MAEFLWGKRGSFTYLFIASALILLTLLGGREIWTQEHRWADIVSGMFYRHDFLHPYLGENDYYDKPLLSYWLIALVAKITGQLSTLALRLPSALAGLLGIWSIYRIGTRLKDKELGLFSGWLLLTTFYFIFWARTSSADMLNMAGSLFAVAWYMDHRESFSIFNYAVFFLILALTSLCKGLVGAIVPLIVVFLDMWLQASLKKHLNWKLLIAILPAVVVYVLPFWASSHFGGNHYGESGLYLVYRENILRYFQPYDHKGPIYTYFIYLPLYLLPWTLFFIPALLSIKKRWATASPASKWLALSVLFLFLFFTLSGSRRNYYILPLVPFAILFTADWLLANKNLFAKSYSWACSLVGVAFLIFFLVFGLIQPLYYSQSEIQRFITELKITADKQKPWAQWNVVMLDAESKISFYLQLPPDAKNYGVNELRQNLSEEKLLKTWTILQSPPPRDTIILSRKLYAPFLQSKLLGYQTVQVDPSFLERLFKRKDNNEPIAFIPIS